MGTDNDSDLHKVTTFAFTSTVLPTLSYVVEAPYLRLLGFSPVEYGILGSLTTAASLALVLITGWLTDRCKASTLVFAALLLESAGYALTASGLRPLIYLASVLTGASSALFTIPIEVLVSRTTSEERFHYSYTYLYASMSFGNAVGAILGWVPERLGMILAVSTLESYRYCLLIVALLNPLPALFLLGLHEEVGNASRRSSSAGLHDTALAFKTLGQAFYKLVMFEGVVALGASLAIHNANYYFTLKYGVGSGELGTLQFFESLGMGVLMLTMPKLSERVGNPLKTYAYVAFTSLPLLVVITCVNDYYLAMALFVARTIIMNVASPLFTAFTMSILPKEHRGKALSLMNIVRDLVSIAGRSLGGYLLNVNLEYPFRITAGLYCMALIYLLLAFRNAGQEMSKPSGKSLQSKLS
jgi:hypothetical protein